MFKLTPTNRKKSYFLQNLQKTINMNTIIPLNLFQTWHTLNLPLHMNQHVEILRAQNPEFTYYLYDDAMCREYIEHHFDKEVLYSFDKLKPGAYKADLWRYCILYKKGGIYLDIKYTCINHFNLMQLTDKEYYVKDRMYKGTRGIYNALLCVKPNNPILYKCIQSIVHNVKHNIYGFSELCTTGPHLMSNYFSINEINQLPLSFNGNQIILNQIPILSIYEQYRIEQAKTMMKHYIQLWHERDIFNYPLLESVKTYTYDIVNVPIPYTIYKWFPLQFIKEKEGSVIKTMPHYFANTINTTNGYATDTEIWFILTNMDKDFFVVFDLSMNLLRYSELCSIKKCKNIKVIKDAILLSDEGDTHEYSMESIQRLKWY